MKNLSKLFAFIAVFSINSVSAQSDLSGIWEGDLVVAPDQTIVVQFTLQRAADGSYTGLLNAPDQPSLTDVPIDSISLDQTSLTMNVSAVSGVYQGTISEGNIRGSWSQQGTTFDLNLVPYQEPVLSQAAFERISGSWIGVLRPIPGSDLEFTVVVRFEQDAEGEFKGFLSIPDQGGNNIPIDSIALEGDELVLTISQAQAEITGSLSGESFSGTWNQGGQSLPLNLEKGEYEPEGLSLSALNYARLQGPWHGQVASLTVVFRVEQVDGKYLAFLDSPDQGASDIPITTLEVNGDDLTFEIAAAGASFSGQISAEELSGEWNQGGQTTQLALVRGPYTPSVNLSDQVMQQLAGTWQGEVNDTQLVFRFTLDADGHFEASLDIPSLGANGLPLSNLNIEGENFSFGVGGIGAEFAGTLSGNQLNGEWTRAGDTNPLLLNKD